MRNLVTVNDVHQQFAEYFDIPALKPYAYLLSKKGSEGHICLHLSKLEQEWHTLPEAYRKIETGNVELRNLPVVGSEEDNNQPFVVYQDRLYMQRYFRYESNFLNKIRLFLDAEKAVLNDRITQLQEQKALIQRLFSSSNKYIDWQLAAAITGVLNNFTIITGGPGTGKTTTVAKLLALLYATEPNLKVALAAPTGKAAARMAESLRNTNIESDESTQAAFQRLQPSTIHRLLGSLPDTHRFKHNQLNPLIYDVIIIDESSMIDVALFAKLLDAVPPTTRLILLGDKDQLAAVEAGSLFGDLCQAQDELNLFSPERSQFINNFIPVAEQQIPASMVKSDAHPLFEHLIELRHSHRFSGDQGIGKFSKAIITNNEAAIRSFFHSNADDQIIIDPEYNTDLFEKFVSRYTDFIQEKDISKALLLLNAQRVLTAIREGAHGLYTINKQIEKYLHEKQLINANAEFYNNRPIILTRNYYEHGLFNGDTGIIRLDENNTLMAWFIDSTGNLKSVLPGYLTQAETAFAMTVHKSQGSEFGEVMIILPDTPEIPILTRELIYTAVSRAKQKVYIQGSPEIILSAAGKFVERASGIGSRFKESVANQLI
ncbi:exodeoxyribonuclease V subunit alpha [Chitinophaga silvatica]|uniref:RecBCD enzyme subunit RecD n=1 Tax=Chitinophaga silvatica TaxID=2282649 RepID=A0A3E1Y1W8_9BACT|nr:exodeoxyribonuclease V subunit alpha [Chitinophaga silvatica]RFS18661.1 exodeoxyribonuclease V subunit alpha [Chitinophaga silvatica]